MEAIERRTLEAIAAWAGKHEKVRRVWVIGSRASGTARPGSDLDIAVELEPTPDGDETLPDWVANAEAWRDELQQHVAPKVDLQWVDPIAGSGATRGEAAEGKVLAYERMPS
jgi:predicted nucleotidyltransferase